jgi:glucose/arabinose dehydrogenase
MRGNTVDTSSRRRLLSVRKQYPHHNGGDLQFGPDGYLYASIGDGSPFKDLLSTGKDADDLLGSLLRIDPEQSGERPYSVPSDNPFAGGGGAPEVWAYGLRNPWRFSFDRVTGDLWIGDVGDHAMEEIDMVPAAKGGGRGANFGWPILEGTELHGAEEPLAYVPPFHAYERHRPFCALIGGYVYRGSAVPALRGAYLYTDYCESGIHAFTKSGDEATERALGPEVASPSAFAEDDNGELYVLSLKGDVYRIEPA